MWILLFPQDYFLFPSVFPGLRIALVARRWWKLYTPFLGLGLKWFGRFGLFLLGVLIYHINKYSYPARETRWSE